MGNKSRQAAELRKNEDADCRGAVEFALGGRFPDDLWDDPEVKNLRALFCASDMDETLAVERIQEIIFQCLVAGYHAPPSDSPNDVGSSDAPPQSGMNTVVDSGHQEAGKSDVQQGKDEEDWKDDRECSARCCEALYSETARRISSRREVIAFRSNLPGGSLLSEEAAWNLLTSPLARYFDFKTLERANVCPVTAIVGRVASATGTYASSGAKPIPNAETSALEPHSYAGYIKQYNVFSVEATDRVGVTVELTTEHPLEDFVALANGLFPGESHVYSMRQFWPASIPQAKPTPGTKRFQLQRTIRAYRRTIVGQALKISEELSHLFAWDVKDALLFLFSGQPPRKGSIRAWSSFIAFSEDAAVNVQPRKGQAMLLDPLGIIATEKIAYGPTTITVQPWVTSEELAAFYKNYKGRYQGKEKQERQSRRLRKEDVGRLIFVNKMRVVFTEDGKKPTWKALYEAWKEGGEGHAGKSYSYLHRCYHDVLSKLFPNAKRSP